MTKRFSFFLLFVLIFTIFYCTKKVNIGGIQPAAVVIIQGVPDTSRVERGIDAVPEGNAIRIEWISSPDEVVTDYEIYRGIERTGIYNLIVRAAVPDSFYLDNGVTLNKRYYYYILAVSDEDIRSESSDTLSYELIQKATGLLPAGETTDSRPDFSWHDPNVPPKAFYVIRLVEVASGGIIWLSLVPSSYSDRETVRFNTDGTAIIDSLQQGVDYQWRMDVVGSEDYSGSESGWIALRLQ